MIHTAGCESHEDLMRLCNAERAHREKLYQDGLPSVVIDLDLHDNTFTIISSDGDHVSLGLPLDQAVEKFRAYLTNLAIEVRRRDQLDAAEEQRCHEVALRAQELEEIRQTILAELLD